MTSLKIKSTLLSHQKHMPQQKKSLLPACPLLEAIHTWAVLMLSTPVNRSAQRLQATSNIFQGTRPECDFACVFIAVSFVALSFFFKFSVALLY